jgi:hypothetical protein
VDVAEQELQVVEVGVIDHGLAGWVKRTSL